WSVIQLHYLFLKCWYQVLHQAKMNFLRVVVVLLVVVVSLATVTSAVPLFGRFGRGGRGGRSRSKSSGVGTREYPDPYAYASPQLFGAIPVFPNFITGVGR
ncbi:hypothetical protein OTU49_011939, partial [Cherax quadricarinatus]